MRPSAAITTLLILIVASVSGAAPAQETFGALNGVVSDNSGAAMPGAAVTITNKGTNRTITGTTGANGSYFIRNIEPGRYSVKFERPGFRTTEFSDVAILVGQTVKLDPRLEVASVETAVSVIESAPVLDTQSSLVARNVTAEEIELLPKTRTFQYFAKTAPSVNEGEIEGGFQVNGASGSENSFNIDGVTTNSVIAGHSRQNAPFEYLQEVQIKTAGIDAEYGGALGGVISAITRSGGKEFHGEAHFYFGGSGLGAAPMRRLNLNPADDRTVTFVQDNKEKERTYEPGFSLGGPIKQDLLYFFTAWSPRWRTVERDYLFGNGKDPDTLRQEQTYMSGFNKLSIEPTSRIRSSFTYLWTPTKSNGSFLALNGAGPNWDSRSKAASQANKVRGFFQPQSNYSGNIDFVLRHNIVLGARGGYFWDNYKDAGIPDLSPVEYRTSSVGLAGVPEDLQQGTGFSNIPRVIFNRHDLTTRAYAQADLAVTGRWFGGHNLKAGASLQKSVNNVARGYGGGGYVEIYWDSTFPSSPTGIEDRGTYGYYRALEVGTIGTAGASIKSAYLQDHWTIHPRLTLNIGIRAEEEQIPSFRRDIKDLAIDFGWGDKLAPRLGASWDVLGTGQVKVYGSYGRYYDWTKYELSRGVFGGDIQRVWYRSLDTTDVFSLSFQNRPGRDLWLRTGESFRDERIPSFGELDIDPEIKPMGQDQFMAGIDYQWNSDTVIGARYVHNQLLRTIEDLGRLIEGSEIYTFGNPGEGLVRQDAFPYTATPPGFDYPKAVRRYDAVEFTVTRRMASGWFGSASYTWSRLYGNYAGLANSDEIRIPTLGYGYSTNQQQGASIARFGGNGTRGWDLEDLLFDSRGNLDVQGRLATDRPHVLKLNGSYERPWGGLGRTDVGAFVYLGSGTPLSTLVNTTQHTAVFVNGRGDMGRTPVLNYTDMVVGHSFDTAEGQRLRFEVNMLNLFNQKTARHRFDRLNRGDAGTRDSSSMDLKGVNLFNGYDYNALILASPDGADAFDPRYGLDSLFTPGFSARLGVKYTF